MSYGSGRESIFPLPLGAKPHATSSSSPRVLQRAKRAAVANNFGNRAITALNKLRSPFLTSSSQKKFTVSGQETTIKQHSLRAVGHVHACANLYTKRLSPYYKDEEKSVGVYLKATTPDDLQVSGASNSDAVPLVANRVSLPEDLRRVPLINLLPPEVRLKYEKENPSLLLPPEEIKKARKCTLISSGPDYVMLVKRLILADMVEFRLDPKAFNGVFGIDKPNGSLRFLVDARPANALFVPPPDMSLVTPDVLADLQIEPGTSVYVAKSDISDFYHRLLLPLWLIPYFALPGVKAGDVGMGSVFGADTVIYPCCKTLPMGWSHSPSLAQLAHEHLVDTHTDLKPEDRLIKGSNMRLENRVVHGLYIDDNFLIGADKGMVARLQNNYLRALDNLDLDANQKKTVIPSSDGVECVGIEVHGQDGTLSLHPRKLQALTRCTTRLIKNGHCTGRMLQRLVGKWTWAFLARRPFFSLFSGIYRFIEIADFRDFNLWPSVIKELQLAVDLAPLLFTDLASPWFPSMFAVDASSSGQGVVMAKLSPLKQAKIASLPMPDFARDVPRPQPNPSVVSADWKVVVASKLDFEEHINISECRAVDTAIRRAVSSPPAVGSKILVWSDSVVVTCAVRKGRSSSFSLLQRLRGLTALVLAFGLHLHINYIPTDFNPADEPSRRFQRAEPLVSKIGKEFSSDYTGDGPRDSYFFLKAAVGFNDPPTFFL